MIAGRPETVQAGGASREGARMGAMYRLKAYFGMVPAEDMAEYADEPPVETVPTFPPAAAMSKRQGDRHGHSCARGSG